MLEVNNGTKQIFELCGMFLGFAAVLLFSRAIYSKPDIFLKSLPHYSASAWPSAEILSSGADQKG